MMSNRLHLGEEDKEVESTSGKEESSNVIVRVGLGLEEYAFPLFPLIFHSLYFFRRIMLVIDDEREAGSALVIDVPDFPYGCEIFRIVRKVCCTWEKQNFSISIHNVVKLLGASKFLEIERLERTVWNSLEKSVLTSWLLSLRLLANFDRSELPTLDGHTEEDNLFDRCIKSFLCMSAINLGPDFLLGGNENWPTQNWKVIGWNVNSLLYAAEELPGYVAKCIYESLISVQTHCVHGVERVAYVIYFVNDDIELVYCNSMCWSPTVLPVKAHLSPIDTGPLAIWIETLPQVLPDLSRRSLFILYLIKLTNLKTVVPISPGSIGSAKLEFTFLCGLLVEATQLVDNSDKSEIITFLGIEIVGLEKSVSKGLHELSHPDNAMLICKLLMKFKFETLLWIIRNFETVDSDEETTEQVASIVDFCVLQHHVQKSLAIQQFLLIYRYFPNHDRQSHVRLYDVFEELLGENLGLDGSDSHEARELVELLDYDKLSDEIVEKLSANEEFMLSFGDVFVKRFVGMQRAKLRNNSKSDQDFKKLRSEVDVKTARLSKASEEIGMLETKLNEALNKVSEMERLSISQRAESDQEFNSLHSRFLKQTEELQSVYIELKAETEENISVMGELSVQTEQLFLVRNSRLLAESQRDSCMAFNRLLKGQVDTLQHALEEEHHKTTCQICLLRPRDALCFPCMHFLYCLECVHEFHQVELQDQGNQGRTTCPACQCLIHGVQKCILT